MAYKMKGHTLPGINQRSDEKDDKFLKKQNESKVKTPDFRTKTPSIVATDLRKKEYNQSEEEQEKESDEETKRINTTPNTKPPNLAKKK